MTLDEKDFQNKCNDVHAAVTLIKELFHNHSILVGDTPLYTHNGVIQGSINSPWLYTLYVDHFIILNSETKDQCLKQLILAFADDLALHAKSCLDFRKRLYALTKALDPGNLHFNWEKSENLTARNRL